MVGYYVNGYYIDMMDDLIGVIHNIRYSEIKTLFMKYEKYKPGMIDNLL